MAFSTAHALLIGVGSSAHAPQLNVPITAADARAVTTVLCDPQSCGYPPEQVTLLANAAASRDGVLAALDGLAQRVGAGDTVLIFYAGHGAHGDDGYSLTTHDTRLVGRKVVRGTGIHESELIKQLRAIQAQRLLFIVNACHAGASAPGRDAGAAPRTGTPLPPHVAAALLGTGSGRVIISACRADQVAFIGPGPYTLFTQALLDGLRGTGVRSNHGYISVFDLYTHLYFTLDAEVPRTIPAPVRQRYGEKQEPELTLLTGVGPFPVALYHGATARGDFDASARPPHATAVREVNPAYSQAMLRQYQQSIGGNAHRGVTGAGAGHGQATLTPPRQGGQRGGVHFGSRGRFRDITVGNVAGRDVNRTDITHGDRITTGDIRGSSGIDIGRGPRSRVHHVDTGGGDYAEGRIDKHSSGDGTAPDPVDPPSSTVGGRDQILRSGDGSEAMLHMRSTLTHVAHRISTAPHGDAATKAQLQALIAQLNAELHKVPAAQAAAAAQVATRAESAVAEAMQPSPDMDDVAYCLTRLTQAAANLGPVFPTVLRIATQIAEGLRRMIGA